MFLFQTFAPEGSKTPSKWFNGIIAEIAAMKDDGSGTARMREISEEMGQAYGQSRKPATIETAVKALEEGKKGEALKALKDAQRAFWKAEGKPSYWKTAEFSQANDKWAESNYGAVVKAIGKKKEGDITALVGGDQEAFLKYLMQNYHALQDPSGFAGKEASVGDFVRLLNAVLDKLGETGLFKDFDPTDGVSALQAKVMLLAMNEGGGRSMKHLESFVEEIKAAEASEDGVAKYLDSNGSSLYLARFSLASTKKLYAGLLEVIGKRAEVLSKESGYSEPVVEAEPEAKKEAEPQDLGEFLKGGSTKLRGLYAIINDSKNEEFTEAFLAVLEAQKGTIYGEDGKIKQAEFESFVSEYERKNGTYVLAGEGYKSDPLAKEAVRVLGAAKYEDYSENGIFYLSKMVDAAKAKQMEGLAKDSDYQNILLAAKFDLARASRLDLLPGMLNAGLIVEKKKRSDSPIGYAKVRIGDQEPEIKFTEAGEAFLPAGSANKKEVLFGLFDEKATEEQTKAAKNYMHKMAYLGAAAWSLVPKTDQGRMPTLTKQELTLTAEETPTGKENKAAINKALQAYNIFIGEAGKRPIDMLVTIATESVTRGWAAAEKERQAAPTEKPLAKETEKAKKKEAPISEKKEESSQHAPKNVAVSYQITNQNWFNDKFAADSELMAAYDAMGEKQKAEFNRRMQDYVNNKAITENGFKKEDILAEIDDVKVK